MPHLRRPVRRALILALVALVVLAAVGAAFGLALPGIRFVFGPIASPAASSAPSLGSPSASRGANSATATPSARVPGPPGTGLDLGDPIAVSAAGDTVDFPLLLPPRERYGSPVSAWLLAGRLSLVWQPGPELPATTDRDVGLILSEFRGSIDRGYFEKVIDQGTTITPVAVNGVTGFWITGRPHELVLVDPSGEPIFDGRLSVGDTLVWAGGDVTYRLESGLDEARALALAESLR